MADSVKFWLTGTGEFVVALQNWRNRLRSEVHQAAVDAANKTASEIGAAYPEVSGRLARLIRVLELSQGDIVKVRITSGSGHAHLFEYGTRDRRGYRFHRAFLPGVGFRMVNNFGKMPARPTFIPKAIVNRTAFITRCRQILASAEPALGTGTPDVTES